jgi:UDP-N-acetylmuramate dehydrogenase
MKEIIDFFKMNDVEYRENGDLSVISPIKIGCNAFALVYPKSNEELIGICNFLQDLKIEHKIVGRMSNLLIARDYYNGVIIKTDLMRDYSVNKEYVKVSAGMPLPLLAVTTSKAGLSGLEELSGIPGSIGASIRGNAGAFGREIGDVIRSVSAYDRRKKQIIYFTRDHIAFSYRSSSFMSEDIIVLDAELSLVSSSKESIQRRMEHFRRVRASTQPKGVPSLGSTFKRPAKDISAAKLIDDCGFRGYRIGNAKISEKHAGFIVNCGGATASDYLTLADFVANDVAKKFGINLEKEVEIL